MSAKTNKEIIKKINETFTSGDIDGFLKYCTGDVTWKMIGQPVIAGKEEIRKAMTGMGQDPPVIDIDRIIAEADTVMVEGKYEMKEPSGKLNKSAFCDVYTIQDGKILELHSYFNNESKDEKSN